METYKQHRPKLFKELVGQDVVVKQLMKLSKEGLPHFLLLSGPSGTGKTTIARILKTKLKCNEVLDFYEVNAAQKNGVDLVRDISARMNLAPSGESKIWLVDECHQLTSAAQEAFLKILEDTPTHVYFFFATTDPTKLKQTIRNRATHLQLQKVSEEELARLLSRFKIKLHPKVKAQLLEVADGSPRRLLVLLDQIKGLAPKEQAEILKEGDLLPEAIQLARALMDKAPWSKVNKLLKAIQLEPEALRRMICSYATTVLLNSKNQRAYVVLNDFSVSTTYNTGFPDLVRMAYEATHAGDER